MRQNLVETTHMIRVRRVNNDDALVTLEYVDTNGKFHKEDMEGNNVRVKTQRARLRIAADIAKDHIIKRKIR